MTDQPAKDSAEIVDLDKARITAESKKESTSEEDSVRKKQPPIETFWTAELMRRGDYAMTVDQTRKALLMRWNRQMRIWEESTEDDLTADVTRFLTVSKPKDYSENAVRKCVKITHGHVYTYGRRLQRDKRFLISTDGHFLEVESSGRILVHSKDDLGSDCKKFFPRCHVDVDLTGLDRLGRFYIPQTNEKIERKESWVSMFIRNSFPKIDNRRCAQEFIGDTLNPTIRKAFPVLIGKPDGGKSMVLDILKGMHTKSTSIDLEGLDDFDTEKLLGCSFVAIDELGKTFKERKFKQLFGGAGFSIKRKHVSNLSVDVDFKTMGADNFEFTYSEKSGALETRFYFICVADVPESKRKEGLKGLIMDHKEEKIDMLDWMLNGALAVVRRGRILKHHELPEDSQKLMRKMQHKINPCIQFLQETGAKFDPNGLLPKQDVFKNFIDFCIETNRVNVGRVSYEVWCRDYFEKAVQEVCKGYDQTLERRSRVLVNGRHKRVECVPMTFGNLPEYRGQVVSVGEVQSSFYDRDAYDQDNLPMHILERIEREAEEMQSTLGLTDAQKEAYRRKKLEEEGYVYNAASGAFDKVVGGDGEIEF